MSGLDDLAQHQGGGWQSLVDYVDDVWQVQPVEPVTTELCRRRIGQLGPPTVLRNVRSRAAVEAGLDEETVAALPTWSTAPRFSEPTRAALRHAQQVTVDAKELDAATTAAVVGHRGDEGHVRLVLAAGLFDALERLAAGLDMRQPEATIIVGSMGDLVSGPR